MSDPSPTTRRGRGAQTPVGNRYEPIHVEPDHEQLTDDDILELDSRRTPTRFYEDDAKSIVSQNDSPDIPFRYSLNPYRGCEHGCSYCYARPTHEYLGLNPALDFESVVLVKPRAAELFRAWLARPSYEPETVVFSGVTDCYQPAERRLRLTRACLRVAAECRQPVGIVTKNAAVTRDTDLLQELAALGAVSVAISVPTLSRELSRSMEPRTSSPAARLRAITALSSAGVPVHLIMAPVIPGLTDSEAPAILRAGRRAGARSASYSLLRLPRGVREVFVGWLQTAQPDAADRVISRIQATRDGALNHAGFGQRMRGAGPYAEQIAQTFRAFHRTLGYESSPPRPSGQHFRPPVVSGDQRRLF